MSPVSQAGFSSARASKRGLLGIGIGIGIGVAACSRGHGYDVVLAFDPPELEQRAVLTEVFLLRSCAAARDTGALATDQVLDSSRVVAGQPTSPLGTAPAGRVAIFARSRGDRCDVVAAGCRETNVTNGGEGELRVVLTPRVGSECSANETCGESGACVARAPDGGPRTFPNADTTGVPAGTTLEPRAGNQTITTPGTVIDSADIQGCVIVKANDVTIKRSRVRGDCPHVIDVQAKGLVVEDAEIDGTGSTNTTAVSGSAFRCVRCNIHSVRIGLAIGGDVLVEDSYVHDLARVTSGADDVYLTYGAHVVLRHNTMENAGPTGCLFLKSDDGVVDDVLVEDNLFAGGDYSVYALASANPATRVVLTGNHFSRRFFASGGAAGPLSTTVDTSAWANNVWDDDGQPVKP